MSDYVIGCMECPTGDPEHRADCLIALLEDIEADPGQPVLFDETEVRALKALQQGGLIPDSMRLPEELPLLRDTGS